jgi:hypothetical protein
MLTLGPVMEAL